MLDNDVLQVALIALVPVDGVVIVVGKNPVLEIDVTAVKLDAIIGVAMNLNVCLLYTSPSPRD